MTASLKVALSAADAARFGSDPLKRFETSLIAVRERIAAACLRSERSPDDVRLLPVTKTVPPHILRYAFATGIQNFGENKLQEARKKNAALSDLPVRWSIIGHLQTNKVKHLVRFASEFHALDSIRLAHELNCRLESLDRDLDVFVQVNTSGETSKYGLHPSEVIPFAQRLHEFPRLKPQGLMTLAMFSTDTNRVRTCFGLLRDLRDRVVAFHSDLSRLSMGMSGDFEIAIEEGANVVRVGQAIFGPRPESDAHYWPGLFSNPESSRQRENA